MALENGADVNAKGEYGKTSLYQAASKIANATSSAFGDIQRARIRQQNARETLDVLLKNVTDVNIKYENGYTLLHYVAWANAYEKTEMFIKKGAYVNKKDNNGKTPLHWAAEASIDSHEAAEVLLKNGADANAKDNWSNTPLRLALRSRAYKTAKVLRNHGGRKGWLW